MFHRGARCFVYQEPIDMRCGFERLSHFVTDKLKANLDHGDVFLFLGKNRRRLKAIFFDGSGLVLISKRMEKVSFMRVEDLNGVEEITLRDLRFIMHGSVLRRYQPLSKK
jgi:transposase